MAPKISHDCPRRGAGSAQEGEAQYCGHDRAPCEALEAGHNQLDAAGALLYVISRAVAAFWLPFTRMGAVHAQSNRPPGQVPQASFPTEA